MKDLLTKIIELIFGKVEIIDDAFWGTMINAGGHYECRKFFNPKGKTVEVGLDGIRENQSDFFEWIEINYDRIIEAIVPSIEERVVKWIPNYKVKNFEEEYDLVYLYIPQCNEGPFKWKISFFAINELQHYISIDLIGLEVDSISIDG